LEGLGLELLRAYILHPNGLHYADGSFVRMIFSIWKVFDLTISDPMVFILVISTIFQLADKEAISANLPYRTG
jgi:hypothetical protein